MHITGGATALIASYVLGPRTGRFHDLHGNLLENPKEMPGHSLALQCLGVSIDCVGFVVIACNESLEKNPYSLCTILSIIVSHDH